jgi:hypothetical protein
MNLAESSSLTGTCDIGIRLTSISPLSGKPFITEARFGRASGLSSMPTFKS